MLLSSDIVRRFPRKTRWPRLTRDVNCRRQGRQRTTRIARKWRITGLERRIW